MGKDISKNMKSRKFDRGENKAVIGGLQNAVRAGEHFMKTTSDDSEAKRGSFETSVHGLINVGAITEDVLKTLSFPIDTAAKLSGDTSSLNLKSPTKRKIIQTGVNEAKRILFSDFDIRFT